MYCKIYVKNNYQHLITYLLSSWHSCTKFIVTIQMDVVNHVALMKHSTDNTYENNIIYKISMTELLQGEQLVGVKNYCIYDFDVD